MKTKKIVSLILAILMMLSLSSMFVMAEENNATVNYTISNVQAVPSMDGNVSEKEYGSPIITASPADDVWTQGASGEKNTEQQAKVYMVTDENYLYVAATLENAVDNTNSSASSWALPLLCVSVAKYTEETNVPKAVYEQYRIFRLYMNNNDTLGYLSRKYTGAEMVNNRHVFDDITETQGTSFFAKQNSSTYFYEMRIAWSSVPGMENNEVKSGTSFAVTIRINDGNTATTNIAPSYYEIGGTAASNMGAGNIHANGVMTIAAGEWCYTSDTVALMPTAAPVRDGEITPGEYGDPIIVTSPAHIAGIEEKSSYVNTDKSNHNTQRAKIYMTNDVDYLYVAATLDQAAINGASVNAGKSALMQITLSQYSDSTNKVYQENGLDKFLVVRYGFAANSTSGAQYSVICTDKSDGTGTDRPAATGAGTVGKYTDGTYTYEMRIPWSIIPGMEDGIYNNAVLATTVRICDGCETDGKQNWYRIGGDAVENITVVDAHSDGVLKLNINNQQDKAKAEVTAGNTTTYYGAIDRAVTAAQSGNTVTLLDDVTVDSLTDEKGITLDLNGNILSAETISAIVPTSKIIDSSDGQGGIQIAKNNDNAKSLQISANSNEYLPLYDASMNDNAGGYRFFKCTLEHMGKENGTQYWYGYRMNMSNAAFALLVDDDDDGDNKIDADIQLDYNIKIKVDDVEKDTLNRYFKASILTEYGTMEQEDATKLNYAATLKVTGFEKITDQKVTITSFDPQIVSSTGVVIAATATSLDYTYSNNA